MMTRGQSVGHWGHDDMAQGDLLTPKWLRTHLALHFYFKSHWDKAKQSKAMHSKAERDREREGEEREG